MYAVGLQKNTASVTHFDIPKPEIQDDDEVLIRHVEIGIDGSDKNVVKYNLIDPPDSEDRMVLGHESWGVVEAIGKKVTLFKAGDAVVPTVRRGCGICVSCLSNRSDYCYTGLYKEHGLHKLHGFLTKYSVIEEQYLVPLPDKLKPLGVWIEPLSVVEKAMEQLQIVQSRLPAFCPHQGHHWDDAHWGSCKKAVVIGAGPLGFLATALLILAGVETYIVEVLDEDNPRVQFAKRLGAEFIDGKSFRPGQIAKAVERIDIVFEASGASALAVNFIPHLSRNAAYIMTGVPRAGDQEMAVNTDSILRQIVRHNMVILGSVNSNAGHFKKAIEDLKLIEKEFGAILHDAITARLPLKDYQKGFEFLNDLDQVKVVFKI